MNLKYGVGRASAKEAYLCYENAVLWYSCPILSYLVLSYHCTTWLSISPGSFRGNGRSVEGTLSRWTLGARGWIEGSVEGNGGGNGGGSVGMSWLLKLRNGVSLRTMCGVFSHLDWEARIKCQLNPTLLSHVSPSLCTTCPLHPITIIAKFCDLEDPPLWPVRTQ